MGFSIRVFLAGMLILAGLTVVVLRPDWLRPLGIEVATFTGAPDRAKKSYVLFGPSREFEVCRLRCAAKAQVVFRIVAGDLDLYEAAAQFRYLNHEPPNCRQLGYLRLPGKTDEEKLCREVILWVKAEYRQLATASEVELFVADLEAKLASRLRQCDRIELAPMEVTDGPSPT